MNHKYLFTILIPIFISCNSKKPKNIDSDKIENTSIEKDDFSQYVEQLQGKWKRESYPYGIIEFKDKQIKFIDGEGSAETPQFKDYFISKTCVSVKPSSEEQYDFGLNTGNENCSPIKITDSKLIYYIDGITSSIEYKRMNITNN